MTPRCRCRPPSTLANSALEPDTLETVEDLDAFYAEFEYTGRHDGDGAELDAVRAIRARPATRCSPRPRRGGRDRQRDARRGRRVPQLVRHDEWDWHLHAVGPDARLPTRIVVETAMAMIDVIRADEMSPARRLRRRRPAAASSSTCPATARGGSARPRAATATPSRRTAPASRRLHRRPGCAARNRRSTSVKTSGCSECTQCPASLIVTRRLRGNQRSIAAAYSSRT